MEQLNQSQHGAISLTDLKEIVESKSDCYLRRIPSFSATADRRGL
jgi:hypothetical protein